MCVTHYDTFRAPPCKDVVGQRGSLWTPVYVLPFPLHQVSGRKAHKRRYCLPPGNNIFSCRSSDHSLHINIVMNDQGTAIYVKHGRTVCHVRQLQDDFCKSAKSSCIRIRNEVLFRKANIRSLFETRDTSNDEGG